jgi:DNA ligase-1
MTFQKLAQYFQQLESVSSRLEMTRILASLFKASDVNQIDLVCYLSLGRLGPSYASVEFNLAEKMLIRVLAKAYGVGESDVRSLYKNKGDLGQVAFQLSQSPSQGLFSSASKKPSKKTNLDVTQVYHSLLEIAKDSGQGSQDRKVSSFASLLNKVDPLSAKYLIRIPVGKLRLGYSDMTIIDALSWLVTGDKSLHQDLESAYNVAADIGFIAKTVKKAFTSRSKKKVINTLSSLKVQLGTPIVPQLCQRLKSFDEIISKMNTVACEPKYDGTRLQIHFDKTSNLIKSFTRNLEENSSMFPELSSIDKQLRAKRIILDCEAVGVDPQSGKWLPFQLTITRKRKHQISHAVSQVPLRFIVFDVLFLDGRDLHQLPFAKRRNILEKTLKKGKNFQLAPQTVTQDPQVCRQLHHQYLDQGLEGIIVKRWDSPYVPGRKGWNWVKMKEVEAATAGLADTLDCVVMGYYRGKGKRAQFGLGAFLVGVRASDVTRHSGHLRHSEKEQGDRVYPERSRRKESSGGHDRVKGSPSSRHPELVSGSLSKSGSTPSGATFLTISKIGTGLTDDQFKQLHSLLTKLKVKDKPSAYHVHKNLAPDIWVKPSLVVEIAADNITKSPSHTAGLALRFPRLQKFRDDKSPAQATTLKEVKKLHQLQK